MATPTLQPNLLLVTGIRSFPEAVALTGTITTLGLQVTGVGTSFTTELLTGNPATRSADVLKYKYLFDISTGEIREIDFVQSDTKLRLKVALTIEVAAQALNVINNYFYNDITINPQGAGVIFFSVNSTGTTMDADATVMLGDERGINPIAINATAGGAQVTTG